MCTCDDYQDICCYFNGTDAQSDSELPCQDKEYGQAFSTDNFTSSLITVTPKCLTFPYNNPKNHTQRLTIWNRTISTLKIRVKSPDPEVFTLYLSGTRKKGKPGHKAQFQLYGLAARTLSIKCTPGRYRIASLSLRIWVHSDKDECECLQLPLEIFPSTAWFNLPTNIIIPDVVIGRKAHALIILPQPRVSERFFVTFQPSHTQDVVTLSPMHGTIGGDTGIKQLRVTYAPTEYTTVACSINVHFPGLSTTTAHVIKIIGRCRPGNEAEIIRKEIAEIESFRPKPVKKTDKYPVLKFKKPKPAMQNAETVNNEQQDAEQSKAPLSLFTLAGVARFLLSKNGLDNQYTNKIEEHMKRKTAVEILVMQVELHRDERIKIYNSIKKRLGLDFESQHRLHQGHAPKLKSFQRKNWDEFQKTIGVTLLGKVEEIPEPPPTPPPEPRFLDVPQGQARKSKIAPHQSLYFGNSRIAGNKNVANRKSYRSSAILKKQVRESVSDSEKKMYKNIMADVQLDLTAKQKFIQMAFLVITRNRAAKRLAKLKVLVDDMKKTSKKRSSKASSVKSKRVPSKQSNEGSLKQRSHTHSSKAQDIGKHGSKSKSNLDQNLSSIDEKRSVHSNSSHHTQEDQERRNSSEIPDLV